MRSLWQKTARVTISALLMFALQELAAFAEEAENENFFTLERSIAEGLANNYQVKIRKEQIQEANYTKKSAKADFFPKLSTTYGYTRFDSPHFTDPVAIGPGFLIPSRATELQQNYQWRSTVRQPVFRGFSLLSTYRLAELGIDRSEMNLELEKLNLVLAVKEDYFGIIRADTAVDVAKKEIEARESHLEVAKNFYEVGIIPINDLLKVEVELANAKQSLVKVQDASRNARAIFNNRLARRVDLPVEIEGMSAYEPVLFNLQQSMDQALIHRPEIKLANNSLQQADQRIRLARSRYYPEVNLSYDYIKQGDEFSVNGSVIDDANHWQAAAVLSWTFWEWGKTNNDVRVQLSQKRQLEETKESLIHDISLQLTQAGLELDQTEKNVPTTRKAVEQAEENLRVNEERYKAQVTTTTELLDAQSLLTQARVNYYSALIDHQVAKARLQRAMGEY